MPDDTPEPIPTTPAGLLGYLQADLPGPESVAVLQQQGRALAEWVSARTLLPPAAAPTVLPPVKGPQRRQLTARRPAEPAAPARRFLPGPDRLIREYSTRFLDRLPEFLAALAELDAGAGVDKPTATPLCLAWEGSPRASYTPLLDYRGRPAGPADMPGVPHLLHVLTEAEVPAPDRADYADLGAEQIAWWPIVPPAVTDDNPELSGNVADAPAEALDTGGPLLLPEYTRAMRQLTARAEGYGQLFAKYAGVATNAARKPLQVTGQRYEALRRHLDPVGPAMVAELAAYLTTIRQTLADLSIIEGEEPMPVVTDSSVSNLAGRIAAQLAAGTGGRLQVASNEAAFSWAPGLGPTLVTYCATGQAAGRDATVVVASDSGQPTDSIPEGGTKPNAVTFESKDVSLAKYAGIASISIESAEFVANIESAVATVMTSRLLRGIESDTVAAIVADAGVTVTGAADMTAGVLSAIAGIRGNGGIANVVGLAAADWIDIMGATGNSGYLNFNDPQAGPVGTWLGLAPVIVPDLVAGNSVVFDGRSVTVLETAGGPLCIVDPFTGLGTNQIRIAIETWAVPVVTSPGAVATVGVTAGP